MGRYYALDDSHRVVPSDLQTFAEYLRDVEKRRVATDEVGEWRVSTVFLCVDHNFGQGRPLLFETMIFPCASDEEFQWRYSTWDEAEAGHRAVVHALKQGMRPREIEQEGP